MWSYSNNIKGQVFLWLLKLYLIVIVLCIQSADSYLLPDLGEFVEYMGYGKGLWIFTLISENHCPRVSYTYINYINTIKYLLEAWPLQDLEVRPGSTFTRHLQMTSVWCRGWARVLPSPVVTRELLLNIPMLRRNKDFWARIDLDKPDTQSLSVLSPPLSELAIGEELEDDSKKKRCTFVEGLRYIGREIFSLEFMTSKLGMSVRRKGPAEKASTAMETADHTFGARDIRYFGANSTEVPKERQPDDAVSVDFAGEEPRAVALGTDPQKTVQMPGCAAQLPLEFNEEDPAARESENPVLNHRNLTFTEVGPNMIWTQSGLSIGRGRSVIESQRSWSRSESTGRRPLGREVGNLAYAEEPGSKHRCFSPCPIPDCMQARNLRRHVMAMHLPTRFREEHLGEPVWHHHRVWTLKWLAACTTGSDSLESLRRWVNESGWIPADTTVSERDDRWLSKMCRKEGWSCPPRPSLVLVNSLALLAHCDFSSYFKFF